MWPPNLADVAWARGVLVEQADALGISAPVAAVQLIDVRLTHVNTVRVVAELLKINPATHIMALADSPDEDQELALFRAGVRGVCPLDAPADVLARAIGVVLHGELWIRRALVAKLVDSLAAKEADTSGATGRFAVLTPREIEIARLIGQGASNKRIARHLAITERTVKGHLTAIFRKTGAVDRLTLALLIARRH